MARPILRPALTPAALALLLVLAAGCGGADEEPAPSAVPTASPDAEQSTSASASPAPSPEPEGYLPAPSGVTLTEPGTRLALGESAVGAWAPRQDLVGVLDVTVTRVAETTVQASLAGFDLDGEEQSSTPYFVTATVTNVGDTDLGGRQVPLYFLDRQGVLVVPTGVARDFEACPGSILPAVFAPGDTTRTCLIFLVDPDASLQSIVFRPPEGVVPLEWRGEVTPLQQAGKGAKDEKDGKDGKKGKKAGNERSDTADQGDEQDLLTPCRARDRCATGGREVREPASASWAGFGAPTGENCGPTTRWGVTIRAAPRRRVP